MKTTIVSQSLFHLLEDRHELEAQGCTLEFRPCRTEMDLIEACRHSFGIVCASEPLSAAVLAKLPECRVISRHGIGTDSIDLPAATEHGIVVANVPDYGLEEVADHTLALLLATARGICRAQAAMSRGEWPGPDPVIFRLRGRRLGLVGFGRIARLVAKRAQAFGLKVSAFDPFVPPLEARAEEVELVALEDLCATSDFVSIHAPLSPRTHHLIGRDAIARLKAGAVVINTARGAVLDQAALLQALAAGKIGGCALDVFEDEPLAPDHPLRTIPNVVLTPHVAYYSVQAMADLRRQVVQNVLEVARGYYPSSVVNVAVLAQGRLRRRPAIPLPHANFNS